VLERVHDAFEGRIRDAEGVDLARTRVASPLLPLLRMGLADILGFLLAHERRHLWQARQVRERAEFPPG
jgi:hypothetical protein